MNIIPTIIEKNGTVERAYDIYSRLLKDRIIILNGEIDNNTSNNVVPPQMPGVPNPMMTINPYFISYFNPYWRAMQMNHDPNNPNTIMPGMINNPQIKKDNENTDKKEKEKETENQKEKDRSKDKYKDRKSKKEHKKDYYRKDRKRRNRSRDRGSRSGSRSRRSSRRYSSDSSNSEGRSKYSKNYK